MLAAKASRKCRADMRGTMYSACIFALRLRAGSRCCITVAYWPAFALRGRPLSAALSSPAPAGQMGVRHNPWHPSALPCASPRSEHGILGKRRVKLRSPAVGRAPRGCQPDEQFRPRLSGTLWSAAVRVRGSRAQRRGRGTSQLTSTARPRTGPHSPYEDGR
jgi:hypothetical protein